MQRFAVIIAALIGLLFAGCAPFTTREPLRIDPAQARVEAFYRGLDSLVASPLLAPTHVGIAVWSLDRNEWVYEHQADKLFVPASTAKLIVAVAALHAYGPARRFETAALTDSAVTDSTIPGNLYLVAGGAPDLTTGDIHALAERLRALGYTRVDGALVLDPTLFDDTPFGPGWMWDEGPVAFNAPVNAFMLNDNTVTVTVRPGARVGDTARVAISPPSAGIPVRVDAVTERTIGGERLRIERVADTLTVTGTLALGQRPVTAWRTVPDPVAYAGSVFRAALDDAGIAVGDSVIVAAAPDSSTTTLAVIRSAPLDVLIRRFLKESHNLTGEALLKHLGNTFRGTGSWEGGLQATRSILHTFAGIDSTTYRLADGSGISRYTEISPRALAMLIRAASDEFTMASELFAAMPIAGVDGTLARRLSEDPIAGTVRGKTGTMTGVSSLAGALETREGETLVYCLLMNGFPGSSWAAREMQDRIVSHLREFPSISEQTVWP